MCENGNHTPRHRNRTRFRDRTRGPSPVPTLTGARRRDLCGYARVDYRRPSQRATISLVARGCSAVGSAQPCQGWGREFESRHPLECGDRHTRIHQDSRKPITTRGSTTHGGVAERLGTGLQSRLHGFESRRHLHSRSRPAAVTRAIGAAVARFPDTEEVTGSIPVSPTT